MTRKKLKRKIRLIIITLLIVLIVGGIILLVLNNDLFIKKINEDIKKTTTKKEPEEVWPKVYKATMLATGDGLLHNGVYNDAKRHATNGKEYDFTHQFKLINDIIPKYDIAYYNQETLFGGPQPNFSDNGYGSYPCFNSPSAFGDDMVNLGFNLVSLASNHSADCKAYNESCLENSYNYWASKEVVFDGFNADATKENKYNIGEVNGITYGFLNYTNTLNGLDSTVRGFEYRIDVWDDATVEAEINALRPQVDVLIVAMHWHLSSPEYSHVPSAKEIEIANYLASKDVDIILGTHSHCIQPMNEIVVTHEDGTTHKTTVFYSLGNFLSNQLDLNDPYVGSIGVLATLDITKTVEKDGTTTIEIGNYGADLIFSHHTKDYTYTVVPFSKMTSEYLSDEQAQVLYTEFTGYFTNLYNNVTLKPIGSAL